VWRQNPKRRGVRGAGLPQTRWKRGQTLPLARRFKHRPEVSRRPRSDCGGEPTARPSGDLSKDELCQVGRSEKRREKRRFPLFALALESAAL
jgi:hypothetical protein